MKTYNKALDYLALAAQKLKQGKPVLAGALLTKAANSSDLGRALAIIEASNAKAFDSTIGVTASKNRKARKAAASKGRKMTASQRIMAELEDEDEDLAGVVGDVELEDEANDGDVDAVELEIEPEDEEEEEDEDEEEDEEEETEARVRASRRVKAKKTKTKASVASVLAQMHRARG